MLRLVSQAQIHISTYSKNTDTVLEAISNIYWNFKEFDDKKQAIEDLYRLTKYIDPNVRTYQKEREYDKIHEISFDTISLLLPQIIDKIQSWKILYEHITSGGYFNRQIVLRGLTRAIPYFNQNELKIIWADLHSLMTYEDPLIRRAICYAIADLFQLLQNLDDLWSDLVLLTADKDEIVRAYSARAIGKAFQYLPDKESALTILNNLTNDPENGVLNLTDIML